MSAYIEPFDLEEDEVTFELKIRSMPPVITRHRLEMLKQRFMLEMRGEAEVPNTLIGDCGNEIKICFKKVKELERLLISAADKPEKILALISRFNHLSFRIKLLISKDERETDQIKTISEKILYYLELLNSVRQGKANLKDTLNTADLLTVNLSEALMLSSPDQSVEGARALTPFTITTGAGAIPKQKNITCEYRVTSSPKIDGGEDISDSLAYLDLGEGIGSSASDEHLYLNKNKLKKVESIVVDKGPYYVPPHERIQRPTNIFKDPAVLSTKPTYAANHRPKQTYEHWKQISEEDNNNNNAGYTPYRNIPREPIIPQQPINPPQPNIAQQYRPNYRNPIPNWHLVYSGDGKGLSVNDFLKQVVFMARADRVGERDLLESAIHLFSGSARSWYMAFENTFDSWTTLKAALRQQFISQDGDFGILKDIEQRHQQKDEPFIVYLSAMMNMFDQLQFPLAEGTKVSFVLRNMSSFLAEKIALIDVTSLQQLSRMCKRIEDVKNRDKNRKGSIPETSNFSHRYRVNEVDQEDRYRLYPIAALDKSVSFSKEVKCVNCRRIGHVYQDCDRERMRIFCFKCGELGQTSYTCPTCNPVKGNVQRGSALDQGGSYPHRN